MNPDISVLIPTYNRSGTLTHVVNSILSQTIPVTEIIIVDDGSTDDTPQTLQRLIADIPAWRERVRYFHQANQGQSAALNTGISKIKTEWVAFTGHDDPWLPWKLEWQFRALEEFTNCELCFTDGWFMNNPHMKMTLFEFGGKTFDGTMGIIDDPTKMLASSHPVWMQTIVARTDLVRHIGGLDPVLRYSEDHDFLFRLALSTKFCYVNMPMVLIDRSPADSRHSGPGKDWHKEEFCLRMDQYRYEKQLRLSAGLDAHTQQMIRTHLRCIHSAWANLHLLQGQYVEATKALSTAARFGFTPNLAFKRILTRVTPELAKALVMLRNRNAMRYDRVSWEAK